MCVPGCLETVTRNLTRRGFFRGAAAAAGAAMIVKPSAPALAQEMKFSKAVDLTHATWPDFPTFFGERQLEFENIFSLDKDGFNMKKWHLVEHTGTHMDAPMHFSDKNDPSQIPVEQLVVPLVVVNIAERAAQDPDTQLTPDDIKAWTDKNGDLPEGCCIAMNSGWDRHVRTEKFRNARDDGMHFPGFHPEAAAMLLERNVNGIAVDTLSLDFGQSKDFKTHYAWLPANRWGLEGVASLGGVPEKGATLVVGAPKIEGATGGPTRVIALT
jgi:kynurenine formamidase